MCTQLSGRLRCTLHPCQWGDMVGSHIYHRPAELCDFIPNNKSPESPYSDKKSWFCQPCLFSNFFLGEDWTGCLRWRLQSYIGTYAHTSGKPVLDPPSRSQPSSLDWLPCEQHLFWICWVYLPQQKSLVTSLAKPYFLLMFTPTPVSVSSTSKYFCLFLDWTLLLIKVRMCYC